MTDTAQRRKRVLADVILIVSLLLISLTAVIILTLTRKDGSYVRIDLDGRTVAEYSLWEDGEYSLADGSNVLVIEEGEAYMKSADCPDRTCVKKGRVRYVGESIVCLPNRLSVTVVGERGSSGVDLIS
jgi:hypothetical protein